MDVTEQSGVSGFILPGHRVDVVRYEQENGAPARRDILQNIQVLASGQVFTRAEERWLTKRTVTVAVTPEQVDILVGGPCQGVAVAVAARAQRSDLVARPKPQPPPVEEPVQAMEDRGGEAAEARAGAGGAEGGAGRQEGRRAGPGSARGPPAGASLRDLSGERPGRRIRIDEAPGGRTAPRSRRHSRASRSSIARSDRARVGPTPAGRRGAIACPATWAAPPESRTVLDRRLRITG